MQVHEWVIVLMGDVDVWDMDGYEIGFWNVPQAVGHACCAFGKTCMLQLVCFVSSSYAGCPPVVLRDNRSCMWYDTAHPS